jgi:hypothetical protein
MAVTKEQYEKLQALTVDDLVKSYSGKPGCACGCRGTYAYVVDDGGKERGYALGPEDVNPRRAEGYLRTIQRAHPDVVDLIPAATSPFADGPTSRAGDIWSVQTPTRLYIAYAR